MAILRNNTFFFFLITTLVITACAKKDYLSEVELQEYLQASSEHTKEKQIGSVKMKMTYRPIDFMLWQELEGETDSAVIAKTLNRYQHYYYFVLQLSAGEKDALYGMSASQADFNEKLQTLSFQMQQYVKMTTTEKDTIPLADAYYQRMFGMGNSSDVLLVFSKEEIDEKDKWLTVHTEEFGFRTGRQQFRFRQEALEETPRLDVLQTIL